MLDVAQICKPVAIICWCCRSYDDLVYLYPPDQLHIA
jgi:hypothetical protein